MNAALLLEHRELEYLRAAGHARGKHRRTSGKSLYRAKQHWRKYQAVCR
jgi:hypothetical protein